MSGSPTNRNQVLARVGLALILICMGVVWFSNGLDAERVSEAAQIGDLQEVKRLVQKGADVNAQDERGWNAAMDAGFNGYPEVLRYLLEHGAYYPEVEPWGRTLTPEEIKRAIAAVRVR